MTELTPDVVDNVVRTAVGDFIRDHWIRDVRDGVEQGVDAYIDRQESRLKFSLMVSTAMGLGWIVAPQAMAARSVTLSVLGAGAAWASHFQSEYNASLRDPENAPGNVSSLKHRMIDRLQNRPFDFARGGDGRWLIEPIRQVILELVQAGEVTMRNDIHEKVKRILESLTLSGSNQKVIPTNRGQLIRAAKESILAEAQRWETLLRYSHRRQKRAVAVSVSMASHVTTSNPKIIVDLGSEVREADPLVEDWLLHNAWRVEILDKQSRSDHGFSQTVRHEKLHVTLARGDRATLPKPGTNGRWEITTGFADLPTGLKINPSDIRRVLGLSPTAISA